MKWFKRFILALEAISENLSNLVITLEQSRLDSKKQMEEIKKQGKPDPAAMVENIMKTLGKDAGVFGNINKGGKM